MAGFACSQLVPSSPAEGARRDHCSNPGGQQQWDGAVLAGTLGCTLGCSPSCWPPALTPFSWLCWRLGDEGQPGRMQENLAAPPTAQEELQAPSSSACPHQAPWGPPTAESYSKSILPAHPWETDFRPCSSIFKETHPL